MVTQKKKAGPLTLENKANVETVGKPEVKAASKGADGTESKFSFVHEHISHKIHSCDIPKNIR